jgi:hypothetical protein
MLSIFGCDGSRKLVGSRWIPAFAGMTVGRWIPAFAGMTTGRWIPAPAFAGVTFFRGNDECRARTGPLPTWLGAFYITPC